MTRGCKSSAVKKSTTSAKFGEIDSVRQLKLSNEQKKPLNIIQLHILLKYHQVNSTVNPVNKGHPRERQKKAFIDKWSLFGGYFALFYQRRFIEVWPIFTGWSLSEDCLNVQV